MEGKEALYLVALDTGPRQIENTWNSNQSSSDDNYKIS